MYTVCQSDSNFLNKTTTVQPLYNMVHYNMVLYITRFKDGSKKCIDFLLKNYHKWSFFNIIYIFLFGYNTVV